MGAIYSGTGVIETDDTEVQLRASQSTVSWFNITAPRTNLHYIVVGPTGLTDDTTTATAGYPLAPGASVRLGEIKTNYFYINGKAGDRVYWICGSS